MKMIKDVNYIVIPELPMEQQNPFLEWLYLKQCPIVAKEGENANNCAYKWDYDEFLYVLKK
ncbi:MAG: hypothetical protein WCX31_12450 [Salinivirgaceae bacterium]|jgi:hypothetical protein